MFIYYYKTTTYQAMNSPSYMKEATRNGQKAFDYFKEHKNVNIACICCKQIYKIDNKCDIFCVPFEGTIQCNECYMDKSIPIVDGSVLFGKSDEEINDQLSIWYEEMMSLNKCYIE